MCAKRRYTYHMYKRLLSTFSSRDDKAFRMWHCRQRVCTSVCRDIFAWPFRLHRIQGKLEGGIRNILGLFSSFSIFLRLLHHHHHHHYQRQRKDVTCCRRHWWLWCLFCWARAESAHVGWCYGQRDTVKCTLTCVKCCFHTLQCMSFNNKPVHLYCYSSSSRGYVMTIWI